MFPSLQQRVHQSLNRQISLVVDAIKGPPVRPETGIPGGTCDRNRSPFRNNNYSLGGLLIYLFFMFFESPRPPPPLVQDIYKGEKSSKKHTVNFLTSAHFLKYFNLTEGENPGREAAERGFDPQLG